MLHMNKNKELNHRSLANYAVQCKMNLSVHFCLFQNFEVDRSFITLCWLKVQFWKVETSHWMKRYQVI